MKSRIWIPLALSIVAAYVVLNLRNQKNVAAYDDLEYAANRTADWGLDQRIRGTGQNLVGRIKEQFGRLTADPDLADAGVADQIAGSVKDTAGHAANVVSDVMRDLNR